MGLGIFIVTLIVLCLCGLTDSICRTSWQRFYYLRGVTFFTHDLDYPYPFNIKRVDILSKKENPAKKYKSELVFMPIARNAIAFYDKPVRGSFGTKKRSYFSMLHGVIVNKEGKLTIAGVFDYFGLVFIPVMIASLSAYGFRQYKEGWWINALILAGLMVIFIIGFIYAIRCQKKRFIALSDILVNIGRKEKDKGKEVPEV
ncbi:MAG: hypothetical protein MJ215_01475 [Spirochaetia bacterium]|nr:hypothetical protein [Spirochaetia bacterium]